MVNGCVICGKLPVKFALSGLDGKICADCQKNISNIRTGQVSEAREYFDSINIISDVSRQFVAQQYEKYSYVIQLHAENAEKARQEAEIKKYADERIKNMLLSTTSTLDGYVVVKYIDIIYSEAIYKLSLAGALAAKVSNTIDSLNVFSSNELRGTTRLIQEAKDYVKSDLIKKAAMCGANAIIGIDIESSVGADGVAKTSMNGTAVFIEPITNK